MAKFLISQKITGKFEGGYANDPDDKGGETWRGIARNYWGKLAMWKVIDTLIPIKPKTWNRDVFTAINKKLWASDEVNKSVDTFYESNFWDTVNLDNITSQEVANLLFDISVNMGSGRAAKFLQLASKVDPDGKIGNVTLEKANSINSKILYNEILDLRKKKYDEIIQENPKQEKFREDWYARLVPFEKSNPIG